MWSAWSAAGGDGVMHPALLCLWRALYGLCFLEHVWSMWYQDMVGAFFGWSGMNFK